MELDSQWWKGQLAGDIYHALRYKVSLLAFLSSLLCSTLTSVCVCVCNMLTMDVHVFHLRSSGCQFTKVSPHS